MSIELEKTTNELKGVAGMLLMLSELPKGEFKWNEWVFYNMYRQLEESIFKLEAIAEDKNEECEE